MELRELATALEKDSASAEQQVRQGTEGGARRGTGGEQVREQVRGGSREGRTPLPQHQLLVLSTSSWSPSSALAPSPFLLRREHMLYRALQFPQHTLLASPHPTHRQLLYVTTHALTHTSVPSSP